MHQPNRSHLDFLFRGFTATTLKLILVLLTATYFFSSASSVNLTEDGSTFVHESKTTLRNASLTDGCAIVTTWSVVPQRNAEAWLRWHAALGFNRVYLFWDTPERDKDVIEAISKSPEFSGFVRQTMSDAAYRNAHWMPDVSSTEPEQLILPAYGVHQESEAMARQPLHATRAAEMAREEGIAWLLHIDADELFYVVPQGASNVEALYGSASRLFDGLRKLGVTHAHFLNDELLPSLRVKNTTLSIFEQHLWFKRSVTVVADPVAHSVVTSWPKSRSPLETFFIGYMCGKGAVNVKEWYHRNPKLPIVALGVTNFATDPKIPSLETWIKTTNPQIHLHWKTPIRQAQTAVHFSAARILHYVDSDLSAIVNKYSNLKTFR
jgi:hypothetical protein